MGLYFWAFLALALGLGTTWMLLQAQRRRDIVRAGAVGAAGARHGGEVRPRNPFAAVSIRPGADSPCDAVMKLCHKRFLAARAPTLPVPGCDRGKCGCRFVRHSDRRSGGSDRRDPFARFGGFKPTTSSNRRHRADRRRGNPT